MDAGPKNVDGCKDDQPGYKKHCKKSCKATTLAATTRKEWTIADCASACSAAEKCECFEISATGRLCRIGTRKGKLLKSGTGSAYISTMEDSVLPDEAEAVTELPSTCRQSQKVRMKGSCSEYFGCMTDGSWAIATCPEGLAFNSRKAHCDWPTVIQGCENIGGGVAQNELPKLGCGKDQFVLAASREKRMQDWISLELDGLWSAVMADGKVTERPEGQAAIHIFHTVKTHLTASTNESFVSRYASFSQEADGSLTMQAVALVEETGIEINVMAVLSRRSLLNDKASKSGGGKALLRGILETVHSKHDGEGLRLIGTPGDKFVENLYRAHGMQQYGVEKTGMPKLKLDIPDKCVTFMTVSVLCKHLDAKDYGAIAWRLIPGSRHLYETCAHMMPARTYILELVKKMGF